jgi:hypothetical protein
MPDEIVWAPGKSAPQIAYALQRLAQRGFAPMAARVSSVVSHSLLYYSWIFVTHSCCPRCESLFLIALRMREVSNGEVNGLIDGCVCFETVARGCLNLISFGTLESSWF